MGTVQTTRRNDARAVVAIAVACLSLFLPVLGTVAAVVAARSASSRTNSHRSERLVRIAALITGFVVLLHLVWALFFLPSSTEFAPTLPVRS